MREGSHAHLRAHSVQRMYILLKFTSALGTCVMPALQVCQPSLLMLCRVLQGGWEGKLGSILLNNVHHLQNCFSLKGAK